jgi:hypothetical protein
MMDLYIIIIIIIIIIIMQLHQHKALPVEMTQIIVMYIINQVAYLGQTIFFCDVLTVYK